VTSDVGVPQGGIISPLLSNLILHELDEYVETLKREYQKDEDSKKRIRMNPAYMKIGRMIKALKKSLINIKKGSNKY